MVASGMKPPASPRRSGHAVRFPALLFSARGFPPVPSWFRAFRPRWARPAGSPPGHVMGCHDRHVGGAYPVAVSGMQPPVLRRCSRYSIRFFHLPVFGMKRSSRFAFAPFSPPRRTRRTLRMAALAPPPRRTRRDPDSRVSCAPAPAPVRARFAAARIARLIARARRRTHVSRRLLTGFQKVAPPGRATPREAAPDASSLRGYCSTLRQMSSPEGEQNRNYREYFISAGSESVLAEAFAAGQSLSDLSCPNAPFDRLRVGPSVMSERPPPSYPDLFHCCPVQPLGEAERESARGFGGARRLRSAPCP